ncbi:MAG: hypothetical protein COR54_09575 [Elusimicrobia bacterium CG22_combo_CG10-13_8_21_14_all_63_91]|nr:MAG: hypothetical protein COR54_09575 [Elusimicrobia bacterium CG22_combo_CG10-13_8_21_14_all_63_91]
MTDCVTGAVLAGGRSSRFGSDKTRAPWYGGTLTGSVVASLSSLLPGVLVIGKDPSVCAGLESPARFVRDESNDFHPIVGILAALKAAETDRVFVSACDMPLLSPEIVRALCEASPGYAAATPVWDGRSQPLCAVYSKECAGVLRLLLAEGRPVRELFDVVKTRFLSVGEILAADPSGNSFRDIDTPEDYASAKSVSRDA